MKEEEILGILPLHIRTIIKQAGINWDELQEIRLRIQKPVILKYNAKTCYLSEQGKITTRKEPHKKSDKPWNISAAIRCMLISNS